MRARSVLLILSPMAIALAQSSGSFAATGHMMAPHAGHTATLLLNGKVLIAGGYQGSFLDDPPLPGPELYDPSTRVFTATGDTTTDRSGTAILLPDGRVLIVQTRGLFAGNAEIYDPSTEAFTVTGDMVAQPYPFYACGRCAALLQDGRVFVAGYPTAQLYDPVSGTFAATGPYAAPAPGVMQSSTLLADGRVLLTGADAIRK